jgi:hypothetical protein
VKSSSIREIRGKKRHCNPIHFPFQDELDSREGFGELDFGSQQLLDSALFGVKSTQLTDERPARMSLARARRSWARLCWFCLLLL